jgi:Protein of unknown function (DUF2971)
LTEERCFYSNPREFNDPLDTNATIVSDLSLRETYELLKRLQQDAGFSELEIKDFLNNIIYNSTEVGDYRQDPDAREYLQRLMVSEVKDFIDNSYKASGVLSLSATWRSPLLWSHYADEHKGVCIEYTIDAPPHAGLRQVNYGGSRNIKTSEIKKWKETDDAKIERSISDAYFLSKSREWSYEREWRDISDSQGWQDSRYSISAIYFGLRCEHAVKTSIVRLLHDTNRVALYQVAADQDSYKFRRIEVDRDTEHEFRLRTSAFRDFLGIVFMDEEEEIANVSEKKPGMS